MTLTGMHSDLPVQARANTHTHTQAYYFYYYRESTKYSATFLSAKCKRNSVSAKWLKIRFGLSATVSHDCRCDSMRINAIPHFSMIRNDGRNKRDCVGAKTQTWSLYLLSKPIRVGVRARGNKGRCERGREAAFQCRTAQMPGGAQLVSIIRHRLTSASPAPPPPPPLHHTNAQPPHPHTILHRATIFHIC